MWARYLNLLRTRPFLTNALTAATVASTGDAAAQQLDHYFIKRKGFLSVSELNYKRIGQISLWGLTWLGPCMFVWFRALDKFFPPGKGGLVGVLTKVTVNQFTMAPVSNAAFFGYIQVRMWCVRTTWRVVHWRWVSVKDPERVSEWASERSNRLVVTLTFAAVEQQRARPVHRLPGLSAFVHR